MKVKPFPSDAPIIALRSEVAMSSKGAPYKIVFHWCIILPFINYVIWLGGRVGRPKDDTRRQRGGRGLERSKKRWRNLWTVPYIVCIMLPILFLIVVFALFFYLIVLYTLCYLSYCVVCTLFVSCPPTCNFCWQKPIEKTDGILLWPGIYWTQNIELAD